MASESFVKVKKEAKSVEDAPLDNENADDPDFYDVNILAWDQACSPLHLAILNGHIEAVEVLVGMFGADILLPIKLLNEYDKSPRAAVLTLVLALALPQVKARKMAKTLLDWHASSSQADLKGISALHYYANDGSDALDFLLEHDQAAAVAALSHLAVAGSSWSPQTNSALLTAISNADTIACLKILENGVAPEISFSSWIRQARTALDNKMNFNHCADPEYMNKLFKKSVEQPLVVAINNDVTEVAMALLAAGANPNTLPKTSAELIGASHAYRKGQSVLDLVRAKLDKLKQYNGEKNIAEPPLAMKSNDEYLKDIEPGSYKHWVASTSIKYATERYYKEKKDYEQRVKEFECQKGLQEKFDAVRKAIDKYNRLEADLVKRGAKTFKELHPDVQDPVGEFHRLYQPYRANKKPFEISFSFRVGELNDELKLRYLEL
jgi:ankyrin repeat protein